MGQRVRADFDAAAGDQALQLVVVQLGFARQFAGVVMGLLGGGPVAIMAVDDHVDRRFGVVLLQQWEGVVQVVGVAVVEGDRHAPVRQRVPPCPQFADGEELPAVAAQPGDLGFETFRLHAQAVESGARSMRADHVVHQHPRVLEIHRSAPPGVAVGEPQRGNRDDQSNPDHEATASYSESVHACISPSRKRVLGSTAGVLPFSTSSAR